MEIKRHKVDILIIGGGTSGCFGALTLAEKSQAKVMVVEKANVKRSGCLAAGVNAINAYIVEGQTPEDYVEYAKNDAQGIVREDLLLTIADRLNAVTEKLESLGLVILKDEKGKYIARGKRNIKINGENIKPILAEAIKDCSNITILNHVNMVEYLVEDNRIYGAIGAGVNVEEIHVIEAKAIICSTGGAAGLYRPNNPGFSRHKMWYPPFNTGAGYAMGIRAGAEMTSLEMRFIALRCKDTIAPTGTMAQGVKAKQINAMGEIYENKYGITTANRVYGTVKENQEGRGPCYLKTIGLLEEQCEELKKAYLNMAPSQTLKWLEEGSSPGEQNVEIEGTEPYIVGGHTASGYWIDTKRRTTIIGLYAAGDVAGGAPQKYVTGALAEGEIAALSALEFIENKKLSFMMPPQKIEERIEDFIRKTEGFLHRNKFLYKVEELEEAMQTIMDTYAGGIKTNYQYNETQLKIALTKLDKIEVLSNQLGVLDMHELMFLYELQERLVVCKSVIAHLLARKETRWHSFAENLDYPEQDDEQWKKYVNSISEDGKVKVIVRELIKKGDIYEHINR
jgi:adenylylsulfate reductase subunit A